MPESPALKGYWANLTPAEPDYVSLALTERWKDYLSSVHEDTFLDVAEFLAAIDEPNWVVFECEYVGVSGDTCWIVIDMNYDVNVELWQVIGLMEMYPAPLSGNLCCEGNKEESKLTDSDRTGRAEPALGSFTIIGEKATTGN